MRPRGLIWGESVGGRTWHKQFEEQLSAALHTLVAAVEVESDDVKWEPSDHTISLGVEESPDELQWVVLDEERHVVDRSRNIDPHSATDAAWLRMAAATEPGNSAGSDWRWLSKDLAAPAPKPRGERDTREFAALRVVVSRSIRPLESELRGFALLLCGLSAGIWIIAAALGRRVCRAALQPISDMVSHARDARAQGVRIRLPVSSHPDELAELAAEFNRLLERLQAVFEKQQRFTGEAAHQLRTPLTVLLGEIDVALRRPQSVEEYQRTLWVLRDQSDELRQIVESLLFLVRAEGDPTLVSTEPGDLSAWLRQQSQRWQNHPRAQDLKLEIGPELPVRTAWTLLEQLLDNLVSNALKYSPAGTPVTVCTFAAAGGDAGLAVEDRGMGIPAAERDAIFEPFFRSPAARQAGIAGTGLGLALVARIAQALGGRLEIESQPGAGSTFRLILPC